MEQQSVLTKLASQETIEHYFESVPIVRKKRGGEFKLTIPIPDSLKNVGVYMIECVKIDAYDKNGKLDTGAFTVKDETGTIRTTLNAVFSGECDITASGFLGQDNDYAVDGVNNLIQTVNALNMTTCLGSLTKTVTMAMAFLDRTTVSDSATDAINMLVSAQSATTPGGMSIASQQLFNKLQMSLKTAPAKAKSISCKHCGLHQKFIVKGTKYIVPMHDMNDLCAIFEPVANSDEEALVLLINRALKLPTIGLVAEKYATAYGQADNGNVVSSQFARHIVELWHGVVNNSNRVLKSGTNSIVVDGYITQVAPDVSAISCKVSLRIIQFFWDSPKECADQIMALFKAEPVTTKLLSIRAILKKIVLTYDT